MPPNPSSKEGDLTHQAISSYFIGPRAENLDHFQNNINTILEKLRSTRLQYFKEDNAGGQIEKLFITDETRQSREFLRQTARLERAVASTADLLGQFSIPFWSPRYQAHMCTDLSMASILGYFMTVVYNPNNVAFEASPFTTMIEIDVGDQLCRMFGFNTVDPEPNHNRGMPEQHQPRGWGHITCGGTVANLESMWAARNLKFYPLSLRKAMDDEDGTLRFVPESFSVRTCQGVLKRFRELDTWELLNLRPKTVLDIPEQLQREFGITPEFLGKAMDPYNIQTCGKGVLERHFGIEDSPPQNFVPATAHYSWPKAGAITGLGSERVIGVPVDDAARMDVAKLEELLEKSLEDKQAVFMVVAVIGTTEEGAVDPLTQILALRQQFQAQGLSFLVHADAAWGGYFATMLPREGSSPYSTVPSRPGMAGRGADVDGFVPDLSLKVTTQEDLFALRYCDSITVDPHKAGYIPYPAGALAYRDGRTRFLTTWVAPYLSEGSTSFSVGGYGVEGSKPGAAAVGTWLAHQVIGLHKEGHGALLAEACWTSSRLSALWAGMTVDSDSFICVPFNMLPSEASGGSPAAIEAEKKRLRDEVLTKSNYEISVADSARPDPADTTITLLRALGSDTNINAFALNFRHADGTLNTDVEEANYLMSLVLKKLSVDDPEDDPTKIPLFLTSTRFEPAVYGSCAETFKRRLGLSPAPHASLLVLRNVVMSPFATDHDFIGRLGGIFREVVEEQVEVMRARNDTSPDHHSFWVHGESGMDEELFLVYRPMFNIAKHRRQAIVRVKFDPSGALAYRALKGHGHADDEIVVKTAQKVSLDDLLVDPPADGKRHRVFIGNLSTQSHGVIHPRVQISITSVLVDRPLSSLSFDDSYPSDVTPFYICGSAQNYHITHLLTRSPNIAMSAGNVSLTLNSNNDDNSPNTGDKAELDEAISTGRAILTLTDVHEAALQPFSASAVASPNFFFRPGSETGGRKFEVKIWRDPRGPREGTAGLVEELVKGDKKPLATGQMVLGEDVRVDVEKINRDPWAERDGGVKVARWREQVRRIGREVESAGGGAGGGSAGFGGRVDVGVGFGERRYGGGVGGWFGGGGGGRC